MTCDHDAQIRDLLEEREELLTEIRRLRMGNHPAGRALREAEGDGALDPATMAQHGWFVRRANALNEETP